jgi:uncharacterized small protein (DUF1192 family)
MRHSADLPHIHPLGVSSVNLARVVAAGILLASVALISSDGAFSQEKEKKETKSKGQLPANWGKLGLTDEQKVNIYKVQGEFKEKIDKLREEIKMLEAERQRKMAAQLTDDQKKKLAELAGIEDPKGKEKAKEKPKTDK